MAELWWGKLGAGDMPAFRDPDGMVWVWDPQSKSYAKRPEKEIPDRSHASGGDNELFGPEMREWPKNPLQEGFMAASISAGPDSFAPEGQVVCPNCRTVTDLPQCPQCGKGLAPEWNREEGDQTGFARPVNGDDTSEYYSWPDRVPKRNREKTDDSYPSMNLSKSAKDPSWPPYLTDSYGTDLSPGTFVYYYGRPGRVVEVGTEYMTITVAFEDGTVKDVDRDDLVRGDDERLAPEFRRTADWGLDAFDGGRNEVGKWIQDISGQMHTTQDLDGAIDEPVFHEELAEYQGLRWPQDLGALGSVYDDGTADVQRVFPGFQPDLASIQADLRELFGPVELQGASEGTQGKGEAFEPFELRGGTWMVRHPVSGPAWVKESSNGVQYDPSMILVAEHLQPEDYFLYHQGVLAIVTATGGGTSHAALLARQHGWPVVAGLGAEGYSKIETGNYLNIDPTGRTITVMPGREALWNSILEQRTQIEQEQPYRAMPAKDPRRWWGPQRMELDMPPGQTTVPQGFFAHVDEETAWRLANEPSLDECPECAGAMVDKAGEKICYSCGHRQPVVYASVTKQAFWQMIPMALARLGLGAAGAEAGGGGLMGAMTGGGGLMGMSNLMGGVGKLMNGALGGGPGPNASVPQQPMAAPGQLGPGATFSSLDSHFMYAAGAFGEEEVGRGTKNRGENSDPAVNSSGMSSKEKGDAPEQLKDVDGEGNAKGDPTPADGDFAPNEDQKLALDALEANLDLIEKFYLSDDPGAEHPIVAAINEMLEAAFPGYREAGLDVADIAEEADQEGVAVEHELEEKLEGEEPKEHLDEPKTSEEEREKFGKTALNEMGLVVDLRGNIIGQFVSENPDGTWKILTRDGYQDVNRQQVRLEKAANTFTAPDVPASSGVPTCQICGQNHQPGTPCPTAAIQQPQAQPAVGMQPMVMPQTGVQPKVVTHTAAGEIPINDPNILSDLFQNSRLDESGRMVPKGDPSQDWYFEEDPWDQSEGACQSCGSPLDMGGEGYSGLCGHCADVAEQVAQEKGVDLDAADYDRFVDDNIGEIQQRAMGGPFENVDIYDPQGYRGYPRQQGEREDARYRQGGWEGGIQPNPGLEYMTPDTLAETVSGISMPTYQRLWEITAELDEQGKGAPIGGDRHDPEGEFGPPMVEDPYSQRDIIMSGKGNVTSIWDQLTPEQQAEINAAMEAADAEWEAGMERARAKREGDEGRSQAVQDELARHDRLGKMSKWADTEGNPLKEGADYELRAPGYAVPDYVVVDRVLPDKVVFTISSGDMKYRDELSAKQVKTEGYEFAPKVTEPTSKSHGPLDPDPRVGGRIDLPDPYRDEDYTWETPSEQVLQPGGETPYEEAYPDASMLTPYCKMCGVQSFGTLDGVCPTCREQIWNDAEAPVRPGQDAIPQVTDLTEPPTKVSRAHTCPDCGIGRMAQDASGLWICEGCGAAQDTEPGGPYNDVRPEWARQPRRPSYQETLQQQAGEGLPMGQYWPPGDPRRHQGSADFRPLSPDIAARLWVGEDLFGETGQTHFKTVGVAPDYSAYEIEIVPTGERMDFDMGDWNEGLDEGWIHPADGGADGGEEDLIPDEEFEVAQHKGVPLDKLSDPDWEDEYPDDDHLGRYTGSFRGDDPGSRGWLNEGEGVDVDPALMAKLAGKDFSPREQREFIDETGEARNLDKLDLVGTHYVLDDTDDEFAFGW